MNWKPHLPEIFLGISLGMIAIEAALSRVAAVKVRYRSSDTFASLGMQAGNIAMNLMMAGIVFAGLSSAYQHRLFTISPGSPWAWAAIFFLDRFRRTVGGLPGASIHDIAELALGVGGDLLSG
jgi:hypothetical protein